jgi:glyoxylase-like metal-dependent hydrolase (beta-lactamase superfamily II)
MRSVRAACVLACAALHGACATNGMQPFVAGVASAMGGARAIEKTTVLLVEGDGESYYLGENRSPDSDLPVFRTKFRQAFDWPHRRFRKEELRLPQFTTGSPGLRQVTTAFDGEIAFDVGTDLKAVRAPEWAADERRAELYRHPVALMRAALFEDATVDGEQTAADRQSARVTTRDGCVLSVTIDATTKLPVSISSTVAHPILGDVVAESDFERYETVEGVKVPTRITERVDGHVVSQMHVIKQTGGFDPEGPLPPPVFAAFPQNVYLPAPSGLGAQTDRPPELTVEPLADGVWRLIANQYASVLIALSDHSVLVEAPLDDQRTEALLAKAAETAPGKPVTTLVVSHHHFDHIGGVRAAIAKGLTIVASGGQAEETGPETARTTTSRSEAAFIEEIAMRRHARVPDLLQQRPQPLKLEAITGDRKLGDAAQTIDILPIAGSGYADTLLMVYVRRPRLLIEADVYTPPAPGTRGEPSYPFAANLIDNVQRRKIAVDRIVPLHGPVVPWSDLVSAAAAKRASN